MGLGGSAYHRRDASRRDLFSGLRAALTTYLAVRFLLRFLESNRLTPFGLCCIVAGGICTAVFAF